MTKKFFGIFLALMLIFGGVASAAELSLDMDLTPADESANDFVSKTATVRGVFSSFYGEVEVGNKVKIAEEVFSTTYEDIDEDDNELDDTDYTVRLGNKRGTSITGVNIGTKLEIEDPIYGIGQVNFGSTPLNSEGKAIPYEADNDDDGEMDFTNDKFVDSYKWGYKAVEFGGGAAVEVFQNVDLGVEATLVNNDPLDLGGYEPNFSVFASLDFAGFPGLEI